MTRSENLDALLPALIAARGGMPRIAKDQLAQVESQRGASYSYAYADLATVLEAVTLSLSANQLVLVQSAQVGDGAVTVETVLYHASGQWLAAAPLSMPLGANSPQAIGSAITYGRRYSALSLLGLAAAGEDDDAGAAEGARPAARRASRSSATPPPTATSTSSPSADKPTDEEIAAARARLFQASNRGTRELVRELNATPHPVRRAIGARAIEEIRARAQRADGEVSPA